MATYALAVKKISAATPNPILKPPALINLVAASNFPPPNKVLGSALKHYTFVCIPGVLR